MRVWLLALLGLSACESSSQVQNTSLANPASTFCIAQGGTIKIVDEANGQVGYCHLPSGETIEEWAYYRAHH